ncbi:hypothetical protein HD554DRAFT_2203693 [Boletus coccyginus]|nr:hypothetical protein HD554DRAFT_2203693 [Boletus coccyginus]
MKPNGSFEKLLKTTPFVSHLISIIMDEAHCLTKWKLGWLQYILPSNVHIYITSAMLTKSTLSDIAHLLHVQQDKLVTVWCSTDRPNIKIEVKKIKYALNSFADLAFLIPNSRFTSLLLFHA